MANSGSELISGPAAAAAETGDHGDRDAAGSGWAAVLTADPHRVAAYADGFEALRAAGRDRDAEALALRGVQVCPDAWDLWHLHALAAYERDDFVEAARRWGEMHDRFPDVALGYQFALLALRMAERIEEAEALAVVAVSMFEDDRGIWDEYVLLALHREDWVEAASRAAAMRSVFPDHELGYRIGIIAAREAGDLSEADRIGEAGLEALTDSFDVCREHAQTAARRGDLSTLARRWAAITERFPDNPESYVGRAIAEREAARFNLAENRIRAADALAQVGMAQFPDRYDVGREYALNASHGRHWDEAARRWAELRARFPNEPEAYVLGAIALRHAGDRDGALSVIRDGLAGFADDPDLWIERARIAADAQDPIDAATHWQLVRLRFPGRPEGYDGGITALRDANLFDQADALTGKYLSQFPDKEALRLFTRFESLGDNSEFAMVQRFFGAEPSGLLSWADVRATSLIDALNNDFAGVGDPLPGRVRVSNDDSFDVVDAATGIRIRTLVSKWDVPEAVFLPRWRSRAEALRDKLLADLRRGARIFVYKVSDSRIADSIIQDIHQAIRNHGGARLLCVIKTDDPALDGTVDYRTDGLMIGCLVTLSPGADPAEINFEAWSRLCERAAALIDRQ